MPSRRTSEVATELAVVPIPATTIIDTIVRMSRSLSGSPSMVAAASALMTSPAELAEHLLGDAGQTEFVGVVVKFGSGS